MRFALIGDELDGLEMARALVHSGRHQLAFHVGSASGYEWLQGAGVPFRAMADLEEVLADPSIDAAIIASPLAVRAAQLRRALQSERHVLCVHPADVSPDGSYEAAMIQLDTGRVLLPLLPEAHHPALFRLKQMLEKHDDQTGTHDLITVRSPRSLGNVRPVGVNFATCFTGWSILRHLKGEIAEVFGYSENEDPGADRPLLIAGRFESGGIFQASLVERADSICAIHLVGRVGHTKLLFPTGWRGPARYSNYQHGELVEEADWEKWDPWAALVDIFENAVAAGPKSSAEHLQHGAAAKLSGRLLWDAEIRSLELDLALHRSIHQRRASTLEYQEATEEVSFKGTMTLLGCGLLWTFIVLLILSRWFPRMGWIIPPLLIGFLALQVLRWIVPRSSENHPRRD